MNAILYIEDEIDIGQWVTNHLEERGYTVHWLKSGDQSLAFVNDVDLVILDVMLPGLDGFSVGKRIKGVRAELPILMLSARSAVEDKLEGLEFADDYLLKPFHPDELNARIEVLLRRYSKNVPESIKIDHLILYSEDSRLIDSHTNQEVFLTGKQYKIFHYFLQNQNRILTKEQIYEKVWGQPYLEGDKTLMVHIRHLREKIEKKPASPTIIETIRGVGYRLQT